MREEVKRENEQKMDGTNVRRNTRYEMKGECKDEREKGEGQNELEGKRRRR